MPAPSQFLELLGMPGEYLRGALAGKPGERLSGNQLIDVLRGVSHPGWQPMPPGLSGTSPTDQASREMLGLPRLRSEFIDLQSGPIAEQVDLSEPEPTLLGTLAELVTDNPLAILGGGVGLGLGAIKGYQGIKNVQKVNRLAKGVEALETGAETWKAGVKHALKGAGLKTRIKNYKRADQDVLDALAKTGLGMPGPEGGAVTFSPLPFAKGRGGILKTMPDADLTSLRQMIAPSFLGHLPAEKAVDLSKQMAALDDLQKGGLLSTDPKTGGGMLADLLAGQRIGDMPLVDALPLVPIAQGKLASQIDALNPIERWLQRRNWRWLQ